MACRIVVHGLFARCAWDTFRERVPILSTDPLCRALGANVRGCVLILTGRTAAAGDLEARVCNRTRVAVFAGRPPAFCAVPIKRAANTLQDAAVGAFDFSILSGVAHHTRGVIRTRRLADVAR